MQPFYRFLVDNGLWVAQKQEEQKSGRRKEKHYAQKKKLPHAHLIMKKTHKNAN